MGENGGYKQQERQSPVPLMTGEQRWGEPIPEKRKAELDRYLQNWKAEKETGRSERRSPFDQVRLTGADIFHLATRALPDLKEERGPANAPVHEALQDVNGSPTLDLSTLQLQGAVLTGAQLQGAMLTGVQLQGAVLTGAQLQGAVLDGAQLQGALLDEAQLEQAVLRGAQLQGAVLRGAQLQGALLDEARLEQTDLTGAQLERTFLAGAQLQRAVLTGARLEQSILRGAQLQGAILTAAQLQGALLDEAQMQGAVLTQVSFDTASRLNNAVLTDANFDQVIFGNTNLTVVDWSLVDILGEEHLAHQSKTSNGRAKDQNRRVAEYKAAVRANRMLEVALEDQGLNEDAHRFAYRAKVLQREVLRRQRNLGAYLFSLFLAAVAGYGYRLVRIVITYAIILALFTVAYYAAGQITATPITWSDALLVSFTAVHGRVFLGQFGLHSALSWIAGVEAVVGILIEAIFIAMLIQRFFSR